MTHPTENILNLIKTGIQFNVEDLKNVFFVDAPITQDELPCATITALSEGIEVYATLYLVNLSVQITWHFIGEHKQTEKILSVIAACDQIVKDISAVMTVTEESATELEKSEGLEKTVLKCSKIYNLKYTRTRGL